jgi:hypothetical protein
MWSKRGTPKPRSTWANRRFQQIMQLEALNEPSEVYDR